MNFIYAVSKSQYVPVEEAKEAVSMRIAHVGHLDPQRDTRPFVSDFGCQ